MVALIDAESRRPGSWLHGRSILTSPIQCLPWGRSHVQQYLPLLPLPSNRSILVLLSW